MRVFGISETKNTTGDIKPIIAVFGNDPRFAAYNPPPSKHCPFCGAEIYAAGLYFAAIDEVKWRARPVEMCDCEGRRKANADANRKAIRTAFVTRDKSRAASAESIALNAGISARFAARTFDRFIATEDNKSALIAAKKFLINFEKLLPIFGATDRNGLMLIGSVGTGKTHLASAIVNAIPRDYSKLYFTAQEMLGKIRAGFDADFISLLKNVSLLVIDDIGKEKSTEWAVAALFEIINARYEKCLPTIVTSNYGGDALIKRLTSAEDPTAAKAIVDRLREMCVSIKIMGESWRRK